LSAPVIGRSHLVNLRESRLEEFLVGGGSNKLKVRLGILNLAELPDLAIFGLNDRARTTTAFGR
jgi:hypothetical protein